MNAYLDDIILIYNILNLFFTSFPNYFELAENFLSTFYSLRPENKYRTQFSFMSAFKYLNRAASLNKIYSANQTDND